MLFPKEFSVEKKKYMSFHMEWIGKVPISPEHYSEDFVPVSVSLFSRENGRFL